MEQTKIASNDMLSETFVEKRNNHRRRVLKSGVLRFNKGYSSFGCLVRNLNEDGALLEMGETTGLPRQFDFEIGDGAGRASTLVWRTSNRLGIHFNK